MSKVTHSNILQVLEASIPHRFNDISPFDFEDIIALAYENNGFEVKQTPYSGDFGADVIIKDTQGISTVIQVKRYSENNKVGVKDLNQLLGSLSYYSCANSILLTTSTLTKQAEKLAKKTKIKILLWDDILDLFKNAFFNGSNYYDFFTDSGRQDQESLIIKSSKVDFFSMWSYGNKSLTTIHLEITNNSNNNLILTFDLPKLIRIDNSSIEAKCFINIDRKNIKIFNKESCNITIGFLAEQLREINIGDRILFHVELPNPHSSERIMIDYTFEKKYSIKIENEKNQKLLEKQQMASTLNEKKSDWGEMFLGGLILSVIFLWLLFAVLYSLFNT